MQGLGAVRAFGFALLAGEPSCVGEQQGARLQRTLGVLLQMQS